MKFKFILILFLGIFLAENIFAGAITIPPQAEIIKNISIPVVDTTSVGWRAIILGIVNLIIPIAIMFIQGMLVVYIVFVGMQMIMSMGTNEEQLSSAKRQLWYSIIGVLFLNIPLDIFYALVPNSISGGIGGVSGSNWSGTDLAGNPIISSGIENFLTGSVVEFLLIIIGVLGFVSFLVAGFQLMRSRGRDEYVGKAKERMIYSAIALIFVGFISALKKFVITQKISEGLEIFNSIVRLALYFVAPVVVIFLCIAGWYYVTSAGDEEKMKKGKNILINTSLALLILIVSYGFLVDLIGFNL